MSNGKRCFLLTAGGGVGEISEAVGSDGGRSGNSALPGKMCAQEKPLMVISVLVLFI